MQQADDALDEPTSSVRATALDRSNEVVVRDALRFSALFLALWTVRVGVYALVDAKITDPTLALASALLWKTALWVVLPWAMLAKGRGLDLRAATRLTALGRPDGRAVRWLAVVLVGTAVWGAAVVGVQGHLPSPTATGLVSLFWSAAVCEEVLFRGFLLGRLLEGVKPATAVIATAVIFGFAHLPGWLAITHMSPAVLPVQFAYVVAVGLIGALLRLRSGSLYPAIAFHFLLDAVAS